MSTRQKILLVIALVVVLLVSIVLIRTALFTSKQIKVDPVTDIVVNAKEVAEHLAHALRFQTISYQDPARLDGKEFLGFHNYLQQIFPKVHLALTKEIVGEYSLLFTWKGREARLKPILFMAHMDVVPVEPGTEDDWTYPPFAGQVSEGYIWGRGAMDDKVGVLGILEAVETLLGQGFQPRRTVYLAFGHDEEVGGQRGAASIAALLQSKGIELEYVLDEGLVITHGIIPGISAPVAMVGIAEKGYLSVELVVQSQGGHSSMPPQHTAIGILSTAIHELEEHQVPGEIEGTVQQMFEYLGPEMPFAKRMVFANLWLFGWWIERQLTASPMMNTMIRTTTAATIVEGGVKENILPNQARAVVNFRIRPGDSISSVINHVRRAINDPQVKIKPLENILSEPSVESNIESQSFQILYRTIRQIFPEVLVTPSLLIAATDSRHYAKLSNNIYRFVPQRVGPEDRRRLHGTNERISVENFEQIVKFYIQLIRNSELILAGK